MSKISVLAIRVGGRIERIEMDGTLEAMQEFVGGYIEAVRVTDKVDLWCNEEGKFNGLEPNIVLSMNDEPYDIIHGDVFIACHDDEGNTTSLDDINGREFSKRLGMAHNQDGKYFIAINMK